MSKKLITEGGKMWKSWKSSTRKKRLKRKYQIPSGAVLCGIVLLAVLFGGAAFAKYIHQSDKGGMIRAKQFYFTSDILQEQDADTLQLTPLNDTEGNRYIEFSLGNNGDELRCSEVDIRYEVKVTYDTEKVKAQSFPAENIEYYDADHNKLDADGKLTKDDKSEQTVRLTKLEPGTTYHVSVLGYSVNYDAEGNEIDDVGYYKTLTGSFRLQEEAEVYKSLDTSNKNYVLLTVWGRGKVENLSISFPADVIPDNTDAIMREVEQSNGSFDDKKAFQGEEPDIDPASLGDGDGTGSENGEDAEYKTYTSHTYRFFVEGKTDVSQITVDNFKVTYKLTNGDEKSAEKKELSEPLGQ